jgi:hypothetical protein
MIFRRSFLFLAPLCAALAACAGRVEVGQDAIAGKTPDAFVDMHQVQAAYIGSGSTGTGFIVFRGQTYNFNVGGLGVGGIGISEIDAEGEAYNLPNLSMFPGAYAQARYGFAAGTLSGGDLWLQNEAGVILHLKAKRRGLMLSLGGDAVVIQMQ